MVITKERKSVYAVIWLLMLTFTSCIELQLVLQEKDYQFIYNQNAAPRALLVDTSSKKPVQSVATTAFTICLFVKLTDLKDSRNVNLFSFSSRQAGKLNEILLELNYNDSHTNLYIHGSKASFDEVPKKDEWTHVCASWSSKTGNTYLYINGKQASKSPTVEKGYELKGDGYFILGQKQRDYNGRFDSNYGIHGKLTKFNLWQKQLTQDEVNKVQSCSLEGNFVAWSNPNVFTWDLYDRLERQEAEDVCGMITETPKECGCNDLVEKLQQKLSNSTADFQSQLNQLQKTIDKTVRDYEKRSTVRYTELLRMHEIYVNEHANLNQEFKSLNPRIERCEKEIYILKKNRDGDKKQISQLQQQNKDNLQSVQLLTTMIENLSKIRESAVKSKSCPDKFTKIDENCYYFSEIALSWNDSVQFCERLDPRSKLVAFETEQKWKSVRNYLNKPDTVTSLNYYIGGTDREQEGNWVWQGTNQPFRFNAWCKGEPNNLAQIENCAHIWFFENEICWNDIPCDTLNTLFICEA